MQMLLLRLFILAAVGAVLAVAKVPPMPLTLLKDPTALCLDGSPGGFYTYVNRSDTRWVIFLQGGGWCYSLAECVGRAGTDLGSSDKWPPSMKDDEAPGLFDSDPNVNPFWAFNKVYVMYCDGASFSGNADGGVQVGSTKLHFRGKAILRSVIATLLAQGGLASATEVLLSGCSAGGLSTYLHADAVGAMLPPTVVRYKAAPISGFFLDRSTLTNELGYNALMRNVYRFQNASVDEDCVEARFSSPELCMFAEHVWPFISTPVFATNSMYDSWSLGNILVPDGSWGACIDKLASCNVTQVQTLNAVWQTTFLQRVLVANTLYAPTSELQNRNGCYLDSLVSHCEAGFVWNDLQINGVTPAQAWWRWFNDLQSTNRYIDCTLHETAPYSCTQLNRRPYVPMTVLAA